MLAAVRRRQPRFFKALAATATALVLANIYFLPASGWYQKSFFVSGLFDRHAVEAYVREQAPARKLIEYLNLKSPGEPVWFIGSNQIAGLIGRPFAALWHQPLFQREAAGLHTVSDVLALGRKYGVSHFIAPADTSQIEEKPVAVLRAFLEQETVEEYEFGALRLSRLRDDSSFATEVFDGAQFKAGWFGWQQTGHVQIASGSGQARVTLSDTLARAVPMEASRIYRYSLEAFCPAPETLLRLQINWHDASNRFLGTSLDPRACGPEWRLHTKDVTPPPGTKTGIVIVGGHTSAAVLVRSASLRF